MHARRIEVKPITSDEDFWDFYEKPFAQSQLEDFYLFKYKLLLDAEFNL